MQRNAWMIAPWCLVAVLFFCGADQAPKPIPEYMKLLLLEERMQTDLLQLIAAKQNISLDEDNALRHNLMAEMAAHTMLLAGEGTAFDNARGRYETNIKGFQESMADKADSIRALSPVLDAVADDAVKLAAQRRKVFPLQE